MFVAGSNLDLYDFRILYLLRIDYLSHSDSVGLAPLFSKQPKFRPAMFATLGGC